jgi:hypothetical protein
MDQWNPISRIWDSSEKKRRLTYRCHQGPEGRPLNVSPARKGWVRMHDDDERRGRDTHSWPFSDLRSGFAVISEQGKPGRPGS